MFLYSQVEQLDKLGQYTNLATEAIAAEDGELGELSNKFYQAAVQVGVFVRSTLSSPFFLHET